MAMTILEPKKTELLDCALHRLISKHGLGEVLHQVGSLVYDQYERQAKSALSTEAISATEAAKALVWINLVKNLEEAVEMSLSLGDATWE